MPLWRVTDWEPYELSAVPIGFDAGSQFRAGGNAQALYPCKVAGISAAQAAQLRMRLAALAAA
ncbi:hypothetical protein D3C83_228850 [compost metagenome]